MVVRTRFAPSPTGFLHVGGVRTALFSWLYAKHHNGEFILRIEDTDHERSTQESVQAILDGMEWLGLTCDQGPFYQTDRYTRYKEEAQKLLDSGVDVLYDDREQSAGVKFNDSDLIGIPVRVIVSPKTLAQDSVEVKERTEKESRLIKIADLTAELSKK